MAEKTIDVRGESTIASFFNQHNLTVFRIPAGECSSHLSSKKIYFGTVGHCYRGPNLVQTQTKSDYVVSCPNQYTWNATLTPKAQENKR